MRFSAIWAAFDSRQHGQVYRRVNVNEFPMKTRRVPNSQYDRKLVTDEILVSVEFPFSSVKMANATAGLIWK